MMDVRRTKAEAGERNGYAEDGSDVEWEFARGYEASDLSTSLSVMS